MDNGEVILVQRGKNRAYKITPVTENDTIIPKDILAPDDDLARLKLNELTQYLNGQKIVYDIIANDKPIILKTDAQSLFDTSNAAPVFILKTEAGLIAFIISPKRSRIDFKSVNKALGCSKLSFADEKEVFSATGYKVGSIPLVGHGLPCVVDSQLLEIDYIYGGTVDAYHTLRISSVDIIRVSRYTMIITLS